MIEIITDFAHVADREKAAALSEPFLHTEVYTSAHEAGIVRDDMVDSEIVAVGAAYLVDKEVVEYGFAIPRTVPPLQATTTFVDKYNVIVGGFQTSALKLGIARPGSPEAQRGGSTRNTERMRELTLEAGLRTIVAFAILELPARDNLQTALLIFARDIADTIPLEMRDIILRSLSNPQSSAIERFQQFNDKAAPDAATQAEQDEIMQAMLTNSAESRMVTIRQTSMWLPRPAAAKAATMQEPRVGDFLSRSGKEQKKLLKKEKQQFKQTN
ncbi:MAG TPA: hypothetical protein VH234_01140 [Candidatus Saccharimonadales bacterium]|jgi:hypothetical protein|nr:hypothetical protein [Candidatus Saccharimonadales bacterium]